MNTTIARKPNAGSPRFALRLTRLHEAHATMVLTSRDAIGDGSDAAGKLRGPSCAYARTLPAEYPFRLLPAKAAGAPAYVAEVPDPCLWEPAHPHLYTATFQPSAPASAESFCIGLRSLRISESVLRLNGGTFRIHGLARQSADEERLRVLHNTGCNLILVNDLDAVATTDKFGPLVAAPLPDRFEHAVATLAEYSLRHPSIGLWITTSEWRPEEYQRFRAADPLTPIALRTNDPKVVTAADLLLLEVSPADLANIPGTSRKPWLAAVAVDENLSAIDSEGMARLMDQFASRTAPSAGCVGWIAV